MTYGLSVDGFSFNYGKYSIIETGDVPLGSSYNYYKSNSPVIQVYTVLFIPTGVRDTSEIHTRPYWQNNSSYIGIFGTNASSPHKYLIMGR
jgi:hypothetical protein